jgi:hypothetical protein
LPEALSDAGAPGKRVSQPLIEAGGALLLSVLPQLEMEKAFFR